MIGKWVASVIATALLLMPAAAHAAKAAWVRAESPHFIVYSNTDRKTTEAYVLRLEQYRYIINQFYNQPEVAEGELPRFVMYFLDTRKDMATVWHGIPDNVAGFYTSCAQDQAAFALNFHDRVMEQSRITDVEENTSQVVIFHEYAHHFMFENSEKLYPRWFVEGFADYYGGSRMQGDQIAVGVPALGRSTVLSYGRGLDYEGLLRSDLAALKPDNIDVFYAEAWLLTHWFMATPERQAQLSAYIDAYNRREDPVKAFEQITGVAVKDLPKVMSKYMTTMMIGVFRVKDIPVPAITITEMPASARDMLLLDASARYCVRGGTPADKEKFVQLARDTAARWPGDDYAGRALARIEVVVGDEAQAVPWLTAYTTAHPDDADALSLLGEAWYLMTMHDKLAENETKASQMKRARELLLRAYKLDPSRASTLYYLSQAQQDLPGYPNETAINAVVQAHILVPAVSEYAVAAADLLIRKDRFAEAREMLVPLANDPHGGNSAIWADKIIIAIDAGRPKEDIVELFNTPITRDADVKKNR